MLLHLPLDPGQAVEIRIAQPVGGRFHAAGDLVAHLRHASVFLERDTPSSSVVAGEIGLRPAAPLPQTIGARVERVGERVSSSSPRGRATVDPTSASFLLRGAGQIARAIGKAVRLLVRVRFRSLEILGRRWPWCPRRSPARRS